MNVLILCLFVLGGALIHIGMKYRDSLTKSIKFEWKPQLIVSAFTLVLGIVLLLALSYMKVQPSALDALMLGYSADSIFKNLEAKWNNKAEALINT